MARAMTETTPHTRIAGLRYGTRQLERRPAILVEVVLEVLVNKPLDPLIIGDTQAVILVSDDMDGLDLIDADAGVVTAAGGGTPTIQIRNITDSVDMLSTKITIDTGEHSSYFAAVQPVIDTGFDDVATGDLLAIDVDAIGTGATGLIVVLSFGRAPVTVTAGASGVAPPAPLVVQPQSQPVRFQPQQPTSISGT